MWFAGEKGLSKDRSTCGFQDSSAQLQRLIFLAALCCSLLLLLLLCCNPVHLCQAAVWVQQQRWCCASVSVGSKQLDFPPEGSCTENLTLFSCTENLCTAQKTFALQRRMMHQKTQTVLLSHYLEIYWLS